MEGFFIKGFTGLRSISGAPGALKAMHANEKLTNAAYHEASGNDLPAGIQEIISGGLEDERRHIRYIEQALEEKAWKKPGPEKTIAGA